MSTDYTCVYYDNEICKLFSNEKTLSYCVLGPCEYERPTNADRIRAMSDEELAAWAINEVPRIGLSYTSSKDGLLDWLQQPAEEGQL